jgi:Icc-related predicted phosphoesterase
VVSLKVVAISDLHGGGTGVNTGLPAIPECDLLLIAGDVCPVWDHHKEFQEEWLVHEFSPWLIDQPTTTVVGIAGNHDFIAQRNREFMRTLPWTYLDNEEVVVKVGNQHLKVWGSPYSNRFGNWAFMRPEGALRDIWDTIPRDIDILMTHGPAWGYGDAVYRYDAIKRDMLQGEHVGSSSLASMLNYGSWPNLKLYVFGHIHESYGKGYLPNGAEWANVAMLDDKYEPTHKIMEFEL